MKKYYTIGRLASLAGISIKTLRVYEKKGLLVPERNADNSYRLYGEEAVKTLEKIQLMKYLDFSLSQITDFLKLYENVSRENMLLEQKHLLEQKKQQLETVIAHVDRAVNECHNGVKDSDEFLKALGTIVKNQRSDELVRTLMVHSGEPEGWSEFIFDQSGITEGMSILDAGAGYGNLWRYNMGRLPGNLKITCMDFHNTHMDTFASYIKDKEEAGETGNAQFSFAWGDMEKGLPKGKYDLIFFNHVTSYIGNRAELYNKFRSVLTPQGALVCTWGGTLLYDNIQPLLHEFLENREPFDEGLKNHKARIEEWEQELKNVFPSMLKKTYIITLAFDTAEELTDYIRQVCKPVRDILECQRTKFLALAEKYRNKNGRFVFDRDTCLYYCTKEK